MATRGQGRGGGRPSALPGLIPPSPAAFLLPPLHQAGWLLGVQVTRELWPRPQPRPQGLLYFPTPWSFCSWGLEAPRTGACYLLPRPSLPWYLWNHKAAPVLPHPFLRAPFRREPLRVSVQGPLHWFSAWMQILVAIFVFFDNFISNLQGRQGVTWNCLLEHDVSAWAPPPPRRPLHSQGGRRLHLLPFQGKPQACIAGIFGA